jgi:ABC-2 type transport system ATP-binding protein
MKTPIITSGSDRVRARTAEPERAIHAAGLRKRYGDVDALHGIDLNVPRNAIVGFLGPNGAGKTTAIKLLLGLSRPTGGQATVLGMDSVRQSLAIRARVGYLAQDPRFYPHMTARETLHFVARFFYDGPSSAIRARIDDTIHLVGLDDRADRPIKGFSGGERQRLGIAQAHVNHPDLMILDEPAASLDPIGRRDVLDVMARLRARTTVFYSTHILDDVERVSDHVVILNHGRLIADAPTADLLDDRAAIYQVTVRGDGALARLALRAEPWVSDVRADAHDGAATLTVTVTDEPAAESRLLRTVLADGDTTIMSHGRAQRHLEDVFLQLVDGDRS